jgi:hypothetical protein
MFYTKNFSLKLLKPHQMHKEVLVNENMLLVDAILGGGIISRHRKDEPAEATAGDKYLIPEGAEGSWSDKTNAIAVRLEGTWAFLEPKEGMLFWSIEDKKLIVFSEKSWLVL